MLLITFAVAQPTLSAGRRKKNPSKAHSTKDDRSDKTYHSRGPAEDDQSTIDVESLVNDSVAELIDDKSNQETKKGWLATINSNKRYTYPAILALVGTLLAIGYGPEAIYEYIQETYASIMSNEKIELAIIAWKVVHHKVLHKLGELAAHDFGEDEAWNNLNETISNFLERCIEHYREKARARLI